MQVYYYKVMGRLGPTLIPGEGEKDVMLPGDTLQVGEAGHQYLQGELCPFKDFLLLVGSTFLGEGSQQSVNQAEESVSEFGADQVLAELLTEPELKKEETLVPNSENAENQNAENEEASFPSLPPAGSKVSEVMQYLRLLELKGYTLEQLDEVKNQFSSITIQREVERLRQEFLEQSLTIAG